MLHVITPPTEGGVMDFSRLLVSELGPRATLFALTPENLVEALSAEQVLVQYSGYGFHPKGAPWWLLKALRKHRTGIRSLGIYFHELYAMSAPWRSGFWWSPLQRSIAARLGRLSDHWMTNREISGQWLSRHAPQVPGSVLPVFSTIGSARDRPAEREPHLVVFGSPGLRRLTYLTYGPSLFSDLVRHNLQLHDIGRPLGDRLLQRQLQAHGTVLHGHLPSEAVCTLLAGASFGMTWYYPSYAAKSSVFAAYCAHGLCPILLSDPPTRCDGLVPGQQYLQGLPRGTDWQTVARKVGAAAEAWYADHSLERHVKAIRTFMIPAEVECVG